MFYVLRSANSGPQEGLNILADTGFSSPFSEGGGTCQHTAFQKRKGLPKRTVTYAVFYIMRV